MKDLVYVTEGGVAVNLTPRDMQVIKIHYVTESLKEFLMENYEECKDEVKCDKAVENIMDMMDHCDMTESEAITVLIEKDALYA